MSLLKRNGLDADSTRNLPGTRMRVGRREIEAGKAERCFRRLEEQAGNRSRPLRNAPELAKRGAEPRRDRKVAQYALRAGKIGAAPPPNGRKPGSVPSLSAPRPVPSLAVTMVVMMCSVFLSIPASIRVATHYSWDATKLYSVRTLSTHTPLALQSLERLDKAGPFSSSNEHKR